jgi:hypothetical protein
MDCRCHLLSHVKVSSSFLGLIKQTFVIICLLLDIPVRICDVQMTNVWSVMVLNIIWFQKVHNMCSDQPLPFSLQPKPKNFRICWTRRSVSTMQSTMVHASPWHTDMKLLQYSRDKSSKSPWTRGSFNSVVQAFYNGILDLISTFESMTKYLNIYVVLLVQSAMQGTLLFFS